MPKKIIWTEAQDAQIKRLRAEGASWDTIAAAMGVTRWTVIERGRRIGARLPPADFVPDPPDPDRPPLRPGDAASWGAITEGTVLAGLPYPEPTDIPAIRQH
ncbi:MAG: AsnC family protein [Acetobacteraceae bacterium]